MEPTLIPRTEPTVNHWNLLEPTANHLKSAELTANSLNVEHSSKDTRESLLGAHLKTEGFSWARGHHSGPSQRPHHRDPLERETDGKIRRTSGWALDWRLDWSQNKNVEIMTQISNPPPILLLLLPLSLSLLVFPSLVFNVLTSCGTFFPPYPVGQANHFPISLPDYRRRACTFTFTCVAFKWMSWFIEKRADLERWRELRTDKGRMKERTQQLVSTELSTLQIRCLCWRWLILFSSFSHVLHTQTKSKRWKCVSLFQIYNHIREWMMCLMSNSGLKSTQTQLWTIKKKKKIS